MCSERRDQEEENLERWRCGLEKRRRVVTRLAVTYGSERVVLKKRPRSGLTVLRFSFRVMKIEKITDDYITEYGDRVRKPIIKRRWFGHMQRRDGWYIGKRMLNMELPGRRKRGRSQGRGCWDSMRWSTVASRKASSQKTYICACGHTLWCHQSYMCHIIMQVATDSPLKLLMLCSSVLQTQ